MSVRPWLEKLKTSWSPTAFGAREMRDYAEPIVVEDTRRGLTAMSLVFMVMLLGSSLVHQRLGLGSSYLYTTAALSALCAHVCFSVRALHDLRSLHAIGMALLSISGAAFVLVAHRTGSLGAVLFTSVSLLFMVVPLVPWGLREASLVTLLLYGLFASSSWMVVDRFDPETLWALQAFMVAAGAVSLSIVARSTSVRRQQIEARFGLEQARRDVEMLSLQDPLTTIWNRRYLTTEYPGYVEQLRKLGTPLYFAVIDVDRFKQLNDQFGHSVGDDVLRWVSHALTLHIGEAGRVIRAGGDEFVILYEREGLAEAIAAALETVHARAQSEGPPGLPPVALSVGTAVAESSPPPALDDVYLVADGALYTAKAAEPTDACLRWVQRELPRSGTGEDRT